MSRAADLFQLIQDGGTARIQEMITNMETEELFLDYKRSANNGAGNSLHNTDKASLSKAISGFGNSEGGVIIWGVDCRNDRQLGDVPSGAVPIINPVRYKSWLEQVTTGTTVPPHDGVRHEAYFIRDSQNGFAVTYVPKGNHAPYQTVPDLKYMMRAGSNFAPVPHGVLAGMFGRRPNPDVFCMYTLEHSPQIEGRYLSLTIGLTIHNKGPGIAEDAYLNVVIADLAGPNNRLIIEPDTNGIWTPSSYLGRRWNFMLKRDYRLSPDATSLPAIVRFRIASPFLGELKVKLSAGADRSVPFRAEWNVSADELEELYEAAMNAPPHELNRHGRILASRLLR